MRSMSNILCRANAARAAAAAGVILVSALAIAWAGASPPGVTTVQAAPTARDEVWRTIFARPERPTGHEGESGARIALGRDLFHDPRLSGAGQTSCATCHDPARAFTDGRTTGRGPAGQELSRNVPPLYDLAWSTSYFWDGRAPSLEVQARFPILASDEMAGDFAAIGRELSADEEMEVRFAAAFPERPGVTEETVVGALAAYLRSLHSPQNRFDAWVAGDEAALRPVERAGFAIFVGKGGCVSCHGGWRFTDNGFHDIGLDDDDLGREGRRAFKTPSLREAVHTAPYMHDGSLATLADVVDHYAGGIVHRPSLAPTVVRDLELSVTEKAALVAFLKTLSSEASGHERVNKDEATRPMTKK